MSQEHLANAKLARMSSLEVFCILAEPYDIANIWPAFIYKNSTLYGSP